MAEISLYDNDPAFCQKCTCPELEEKASDSPKRGATRTGEKTQAVISGAIAVALATLGIMILHDQREFEMRGVPVNATVERIFESGGLNRWNRPYEVWYGYQMNGKAYGGKTGYTEMVRSGSPLNIRVLPDNPERSIVPGAQSILPLALSLGGAFLCAFLSIGALLRLNRNTVAAESAQDLVAEAMEEPAKSVTPAHTEPVPSNPV
ncbi:MAG: DUF3592 domain-containing protein [Capsulimonadales bacterium]|nr:DUF3592 domain-containing protein [Capsulimonadales bacterium]